VVRVALIHYRLVARGGLESRIQNYIRAFLQLNCKVELIAAWMHPEFSIPDEVQVTLIRPGVYPKWYLHTSFGNKVQEYCSKQDFDLTFAMFRVPGVDALVVPGTHLGYRKALNHRFFSFSDLAQIALDRRSFSAARILVAASGKMRDELVELHHIDVAKIVVSYPPIDAETYLPASSDEKRKLKAKYGIPESNRVFLFVSSGHKQKGRTRVIRAWKKAKPENATLLLIGKKRKEPCANGILDLGFQIRPGEFYKLADALVHPARYEAYGQVIAEALASECPVFISSGCGAAELLEPEWGAVFEWNNESEWVNLFQSFQPKYYQVDRNKVLSKIPSANQVIRDILLPTINKNAHR